MKKKKIMSLLLVTTMVTSILVGCGGNGTKKGGGKDGIKEFTAFFAVPGSEINEDNEIQEKIAELTGVKVKETWLTGQTATEAVGTLVAGGEYPDLIDGGDGMAQLYEAGALVPLDDYIDKYPNIKGSLQKKSGISLDKRMVTFIGFNSLEILKEKKRQQYIMMKHFGFRQGF